MEGLSAYELAQQRIEQRQRKRNHILAWLLAAIIFFLLSFVAGGCTWPLAIIALLFAVFSGIDWYFTSKHGTPSLSHVEQEMAWLFGESWRDVAGVHEYSLALERIHKRRAARMQFAFHLGFFILANVAILGLVFYNLTHFRTPGPALVLAVPLVWLSILVYHAIHAFPTQRRLAQREQRAGEAIHHELERIQSVKLKNEEKPKRGGYYTVGDDGELVEVDQETFEGEKPDHTSLAGN